VNLGDFLAELEAQRARLDTAIAGLRPLLEAPAVATNDEPVSRPKRRVKKTHVRATKKVKLAKGKWSRSRVTPETIAKIQAMDGQGKPVKEIAAACGVSAPTVTKYANAAPVKTSAPPAGKTDPKTGRPWV